MRPIDRRNFLKGSLATAAAIPGARFLQTEISAAQARDKGGIIDTNVHLFRWPFRRLRGDDPRRLAEMLQTENITQAWAGSFEALLHKDVAGVNERLSEVCRDIGQGLFQPFGTVNPNLPDWPEDFRRCVEDYKMPGIRLYPNYHRYALDDAACVQLLEKAATRRLIVQIPVLMEDPRTQHPLLQAAPVDLAPLPQLLDKMPGLRVVIQNNRGDIPWRLMQRLAAMDRIAFDIARTEQAGAVEILLDQVPAHRVLFGSHAPFFYLQAALLKMKESDLAEDRENAVYRDNAKQLLAFTR